MVDLDCSKKLLYVFNFIFWVGGAAVLGFGIWMKVDPTLVHYLTVVNISGSTPFLEYAAFIFIGAGGLAVIVGFLGCCGAMRGNQCLLFAYIAFLVVVMLAEIAGGVMALLYRGMIEGELRQSMATQIQTQYVLDSPEMAAWDYLQEKHLCCGGNNMTDYVDSEWWNTIKVPSESVPVSCCDPNLIAQCQDDAKNTYLGGTALYGQGCYDAMETWISRHSLIMMILGIAIGAAQIFSLIAACCVRIGLKNHAYETS